jgi:hypothetical protein
VIITTLCARAYEGEDTLEESLLGVLARMSEFVEHDGARVVIPNPVRPTENFADRWEGSPHKERAFLRWLDAAERLRHELLSASPDQLGPILSNVLGDASARTSLAKYASRRDAARARSIVQPTQSSSTTTGFARRAGGLLSGWMRLLNEALHRQAPRWPVQLDGTTLAIRGTLLDARGAFRGALATGDTVDVGASVRFEVTPASLGAEIFWQVTNTGDEAISANDLRGRFESGTSVKKETARYRGTHFIECFAVRSGVCVARSGEFVVNIR